VRRLGTGECFGEIALVSDMARFGENVRAIIGDQRPGGTVDREGGEAGGGWGGGGGGGGGERPSRAMFADAAAGAA